MPARPAPASGPGPITADGCPVDLYLRLPALGEADIVHAAVAPAASVLDLGCGTGRVAHGLIALGHEVLGVDQSAEMLAHVRGAETVRAPIAGLDLGRHFGAVLLASHLINTPGAADRQALLTCAARHLAADGRLIVEWHPPAWFDGVTDGAGGRLGDIEVGLADLTRCGDLLSATVRYRSGAALWIQPFTVRRLTDDDLVSELTRAGLRFDGWRSDDHTWFAARQRTA